METTRNDRSAVILVAGDPVFPDMLPTIPIGSLVIAADGGLAQAERLGIDVDIAVGDMDSVDPGALERARLGGTEVHRHPVDKDATDLDLALAKAVDLSCRDVLVIGGAGGRLDHFLANAMLVAVRAGQGTRVAWWTGSEFMAVARPNAKVVVDGAPGDWLSLIAVGIAAAGVTVTGTKWPLDRETLDVGSTRGISNELTACRVVVSVADGVLLVVHTRRNRA